MTRSKRRSGAVGAAAASILAGVLLLGGTAAANASTNTNNQQGLATQHLLPVPHPLPVPTVTLTPAQIARDHQLDHQMGAGARTHQSSQVGPMVRSQAAAGQPAGMDVSGWQGNVDWGTAAANGAVFAYSKATEGTGYTNPYFAQQYNGSYNAGMIRGSYHFAHPDESSGSAQADYFINNGGGWSADGHTLPGMLDIEWDPAPGSDACYYLSAGQMSQWIADFSNEYHAREGVYPVVYTATSWWSQCTGNQLDVSQEDPLAIADYNGSPGPMPYNWGFETFWQWSNSGVFPGDQDVFNGPMSGLQAIANG